MHKRPTCWGCHKPLRRYRYFKEDWAYEHGLEWGGYGDGFFCTRTCAHKWAVKIVKMMQSGELIKNPETGAH